MVITAIQPSSSPMPLIHLFHPYYIPTSNKVALDPAPTLTLTLTQLLDAASGKE